MRLREDIKDLEPYIAGRSEASVQREYGLANIAKLGSNESPHGPFPGVVEALTPLLSGLNRYPERDFVLAEELAAFWNVPVDRIGLGNGVDPIIGCLCSALLDPGDNAIMAAPSFVSYALDTQKAGGIAIRVPLVDGRHDVERMAAAVTERTRLLFVCSPNNPTGDIVDAESLAWLVDTVPEHVLVVVDGAYAEYVADPRYPDAIGTYARARPNVAVLRTFSKLYGLAGLRVGYCVADEEIISALGRIRHYFDVSDLGHVAATVSLRNQVEVIRRREDNLRHRTAFESVLDSWGVERMTSHANFVAFDVGVDSEQVAEALMRRGVVARPLGPFGDGTVLRVTVGTPAEMTRLAEELREVLRNVPA
ncbi:histidinol-phosphate transaminase [Mycolicibacterium sp. CH28]|uniref:histidinol-phosphate transaminase n=1 Tax=Mycolicibacterium sp. CH28 TaxID=2512237 RepID=UPI001080B2A8|nr:histidinol-phosphate transaminase [Mycolicibacterium sp. CH28]TGD87505.1 histidinol-phosphate transaminase [Mycolicibacterium sp. CH28]